METLGKDGGIAVEVPKPPAHLSKRMKEFWAWAHSIRNLTARERLLLVKASEAYDSSENCPKHIRKDGMTINDRWGQKKPHPLLVTELSTRAQFRKLLGILNLHVSEPWG